MIFKFLLLSIVLFSNQKIRAQTDLTAHPCIGQADIENGKLKYDYRKGQCLCWCEGLLYSPNDTANPCYSRFLKKQKSEKSNCVMCNQKIDLLPISPIKLNTENIHDLPVVSFEKVIDSKITNSGTVNTDKNGIKIDAVDENAIKLKQQSKLIHEISKINEIHSLFQPDSFQFVSIKDAKNEIKDLVNFLKINENLKIIIYGVTESYTRNEVYRFYRNQYNSKILSKEDLESLESKTNKKIAFSVNVGQGRANTAKSLLIQLGLSKDRILATRGSKPGTMKKFKTNINDDSDFKSAQNRRLVIEFYDQDGKCLNPVNKN